MTWKKGNTRGTYYFNDAGDEIQITRGTYYNKPVLKGMMKKSGSHWVKYADYETEREALKDLRSFMKRKKTI
jgi:hypothetical protein